MPTAHLVGNSLGGWIALDLAARGRARSCLALSPAGGWDHGETRIPKLFAAMRDFAKRTLPVADGVLATPEVLPYDDYAPRWREAAPHAHWLTLPGVGHVPMWDDPALVVHTIRESIGAAQASS